MTDIARIVQRRAAGVGETGDADEGGKRIVAARDDDRRERQRAARMARVGASARCTAVRQPAL